MLDAFAFMTTVLAPVIPCAVVCWYYVWYAIRANNVDLALIKTKTGSEDKVTQISQLHFTVLVLKMQQLKCFTMLFISVSGAKLPISPRLF